VGLGYVGLPLATEFARRGFSVVGFDINEEKIEKLRKGEDYTKEVKSDVLKEVIENHDIKFTTDEKEINKADFIIVTVPTPITKSKNPDLSYIRSASHTIGRNLKKGATVIYESTVYPGVTEEICKSILENESGMKCGEDFGIGYSPERINPGDKEHTISRITKVVSGIDRETTEKIARLYEKIVDMGVFKAKDIKTAEAAKVIENVQRDLNIALMNEFALIFERMDISIKEVLEAAYTKWNFNRYRPGLVGGHCIPVDPYYLTYKAEELGYHPQLILAGRRLNDFMPKHVARLAIKALKNANKALNSSRVLLMGLTYKENVSDVRTSPVRGIISELEDFGVSVIGYDPLIDSIYARREFDIDTIDSLEDANEIDCVILTVIHDLFKDITLDKLKKIMRPDPILVDVRGMFNNLEAKKKGFNYVTL